jgi:DNA-binding transcriptional MerR regulator
VRAESLGHRQGIDEVSGYTVKQVAKLSGVSVRALHHYDEVGLLKPACVGANGYRYYGKDELLRLQQILFHRELGFALEEIRQVLDAPDFDRVAALRAHRGRLLSDARRYRRLVRTIDETLAALEGATTMDDKRIYKGFEFDEKESADVEDWLRGRFGPEVQARIDRSRAIGESWTPDEREAHQQESREFEAALTKAVRDGLAPSAEPVQALMRSHCAWISRGWGTAPAKGPFLTLAEIYENQPMFRQRFEALAPGLPDYLVKAMKTYAERELA